MNESYDFSTGKRGRVVAEPPSEPGKVRITIRLDEDLLEHFGELADRSGGKTGYQTLINAALREYVEGGSPKMGGDPASDHPRREAQVGSQLES